jgi:hypothetical protein
MNDKQMTMDELITKLQIDKFFDNMEINIKETPVDTPSITNADITARKYLVISLAGSELILRGICTTYDAAVSIMHSYAKSDSDTTIIAQIKAGAKYGLTEL